jgi:hypothetical protein
MREALDFTISVADATKRAAGRDQEFAPLRRLLEKFPIKGDKTGVENVLEMNSYRGQILTHFFNSSLSYAIFSAEYTISINKYWRLDFEERANYIEEIGNLYFLMHGFRTNSINSIYNFRRLSWVIDADNTDVLRSIDICFPNLENARHAIMHAHDWSLGLHYGKSVEPKTVDAGQSRGIGNWFEYSHPKLGTQRYEFETSQFEKLVGELSRLIK